MDRSIALAFFSGLGTPRALTAWLLFEHREWDQLTLLECDPLHYRDADTYRRDNAATCFFKKYDGFDLPVDLESEAIAKWYAAEKQCHITNLDLRIYRVSQTLRGRIDTRFDELIHRARKMVRYVLGAAPPPLAEGRFGPGATVSDKSSSCHLLDKLSSEPTVTEGAFGHLVDMASTSWGVSLSSRGVVPKVVRGNRFFTVPKTSRSRRSCAMEPSVNGFYQLACGRLMRDKLRRKTGIDLTNGQAAHQAAARLGSRDGSLATIDLASASDTVSREVVKTLLPDAWYHLLDGLRSPTTEVDGRRVVLEKFSSMGNGFTFELETLIFYSICKAVCDDREVLVYGDDIIVPSSFGAEVIAALKLFGFTPNPKKTFLSGSFRESCGGDYFLGQPVRAHYLKGNPDEPQKLIALANGIRRLAQGDHTGNLWRDLQKAWFTVLDFLPINVRNCRGPSGLGDCVIHEEETVRFGLMRWKHGIREFRAYTSVTRAHVRWDGFHPEVQHAAALYGLSTPNSTGQMSEGTLLSDRRSAVGYRLSWVPYS
jgi:hypothetical protein